MCESSERQADSELEITPAMIEAGVAELSVWLDDYVPASWYSQNAGVLAAVFSQMAKCSAELYPTPASRYNLRAR